MVRKKAASVLDWSCFLCVKEKNSYVTISKLVPIVALAGAIIALFVAGYNVVLIIAAAIIGAIIFPALLSVGLSVYYKVKRA